jgi:APA family basic amino acid/polyamine antiporter
MFWSMHSGIIAAIAVVFARYTAHFIPLGAVGVKLTAVFGILILSAINYLGVKQGSTLQTIFTIGKVAAIAAIIVVGFLLGTPAAEPVGLQPPLPPPAAQASGLSLSEFALALVAGLFAFGGWHMVTYAAEETLEPRKTIPRALLAGTLIVTVCYIAMNAVYLYVLPLDQVISSTRIAADAADAIIGAGGAAIMSGLVIFSTFGALSGIILAGPRVYYSMSNDGLLFKWFGSVHPEYRTPHRAITVQAIWASILVFTGTYEALFTRVVYTEWIFFALMAAGLFLLRKRPDYSPSYSVWGYPLVPIIFIISSAAIVINQIVTDPAESLFGLLLVAIGLPIYYFWVGRQPAGKEDSSEND